MLLAFMLACVDPSAPSDPQPDALGSVAPPPSGTLTTNLDGRGSQTFETVVSLLRHDPAEGENCVPSLGQLRGGGRWGGAGVPLPLDVGVGTVMPMGAWPPVDVLVQQLLMQANDEVFAWVGGEYEVVDWTADTYEVHLRGGWSCEWDGSFVVEETCVPDAGFLQYSPEPNDAPIVVSESVESASGSTYPAPGGGFLCDTPVYDPYAVDQ